jgi:glycerate dehydrogenase
MVRELVLVSTPSRPDWQHAFAEVLGDACDVVFLSQLSSAEREQALVRGDILIVGNPGEELTAGEAAGLERVRFIQLLNAGVDHIPFSILPRGVPVAAARGRFAVAMAEHAVGLALACSRRLLVEHRAMQAGAFNQFASGNRVLAGGVCAVLGFGETGRAAGRLFRGLGMEIQAINRTGHTDEEVGFVGTLTDLERVLGGADVILVTLALTRVTEGILGTRELAWMKPDAILVNVARGEIVDEAALYAHLVANPGFRAGLDAWWVEPVRHGEFRLGHDFLALPNVVASPHNSAQADDRVEHLRVPLVNVRRVLDGKPPRHLVHEDEKLR